MPHLIERAATGRAKCRGCGTAIPKDELRVGEAVPNLYAEKEGAEATHWYHPWCAAFRRPEPFLQAAETWTEEWPDRDALVSAAAAGVAHHRLPRLDKAERAPSARATCRACRVAISKDAWRLGLLFWQDGRFAPAGYIHAGCAASYLETTAILDRVRHFTPGLTDADVAELTSALEAPPAP